MRAHLFARGKLDLRPLLVALAILAGGCAHEVVWLGDAPSALVPPPLERIPITLAVGVQSFEAERIDEQAVIERFAGELKKAELFQAVMFPIPPGVAPRWELRLLVRDSAAEPDANRWRSALANLLLPAAFFIYMESDYTLEIEGLLTYRGEVVKSYPARSPIRYRYQTNADLFTMEREGLELIFARTTQAILDGLASDADWIVREDRARR